MERTLTKACASHCGAYTLTSKAQPRIHNPDLDQRTHHLQTNSTHKAKHNPNRTRSTRRTLGSPQQTTRRVNHDRGSKVISVFLAYQKVARQHGRSTVKLQTLKGLKSIGSAAQHAKTDSKLIQKPMCNCQLTHKQLNTDTVDATVY